MQRSGGRTDELEPCPYCGVFTYKVWPQFGGQFYATGKDDHGRWIKHACDKLRPIPRPILRKAEWRKEGWVPLGILDSEFTPAGQLLTVTTLTADLNFRALIEPPHAIDPNEPPLHRRMPDIDGWIEMRYLDLSGEMDGPAIFAKIL